MFFFSFFFRLELVLEYPSVIRLEEFVTGKKKKMLSYIVLVNTSLSFRMWVTCQVNCHSLWTLRSTVVVKVVSSVSLTFDHVFHQTAGSGSPFYM